MTYRSALGLDNAVRLNVTAHLDATRLDEVRLVLVGDEQVPRERSVKIQDRLVTGAKDGRVVNAHEGKVVRVHDWHNGQGRRVVARVGVVREVEVDHERRVAVLALKRVGTVDPAIGDNLGVLGDLKLLNDLEELGVLEECLLCCDHLGHVGRDVQVGRSLHPLLNSSSLAVQANEVLYIVSDDLHFSTHRTTL